MICFLSVLLTISYGGIIEVFSEAFMATSSMRISVSGEVILDRCVCTSHAIDRNAFGVSSSIALEMVSISPFESVCETR